MKILLEFEKYYRHISLPHYSTKIGEGVDGEVYPVPLDPSKVMKICKSFDFEKVDSVFSVVEFLIKNQPRAYACVFLITENHINNFILYYYVMEKLNKISDDEEKLFHTILSHEDRNIIKNYEPDEINKILEGLARGLDFDAERVKFFLDGIKCSPIKHNDLHPRNIMKDEFGDFKLIDFDRCVLIGEK